VLHGEGKYRIKYVSILTRWNNFLQDRREVLSGWERNKSIILLKQITMEPRSLLFAVCFLFSLVCSVRSHSQGHFQGSSFNPNDYFIPNASGWVFSFYYSYSKMDYFNQDGNKSNLIEISQDPPFSVELKQKVKTHSVIPMALYFGKGKILNANWAVMAIPIVNSPGASVALDFYSGLTQTSNKQIDIKSFGLGDFYVQPVWLTWEKKKFTTAFSYGFWLPTGKYKTNDSENIGLGYVSHNFRAASRYRLHQKYIVTGAVTFETNARQKDVDFREAPHITLDYGATYFFTKGHEVGVLGFGTWQLGNDKGKKAVNNDHMFGLGAYGSYWFIPGKFGILARANQAFGTINRFGGFQFVIGLNYLLLKY
jgi:hypothetical protein